MASGSALPLGAFCSSSARWLALRLPPGCDVRDGLLALAREQHIAAGAIVSAVGSLTQAHLRHAGATAASVLPGPWEIVSLSGTLATGGLHVHLALSDAAGQCIGGHLMTGCVVHTTLELVIADLDGLEFDRAPDARTGYRELAIRCTRGETGQG